MGVSLSWLQIAGLVLAAVLGGAALMVLAISGISNALNGGTGPDIAYEGAGGGSGGAGCAFIAMLLFGAAGYLLVRVVGAGLG